MKPYLAASLPLVLAHRGGAALWPENTRLAFEGALGLGHRYIETDAWCTRDGHLVLHHDATLDRTTDGSGKVVERTLDELRALDAGFRFTPDGGRSHPHRGRGVTIPTVDEALDLHPDVRLNIEIKDPNPLAVRAMWDLIQRRNAYDRILVAAEKGAIGRAFRELARGRVATSASFSESLRFFAACRLGIAQLLPTAFDALQVPATWKGFEVVNASFVTAAHRRGLHVHVWTINDRSTMDRLLAIGVDGIVTDRPDLLPARTA